MAGQPLDFLRAPAEALFDERLLVVDWAFGFVMLFNMDFCWRCTSAVQKPRAAPAQVFAALSQRLIQGFFAMLISFLVCGSPPRSGSC